MELFFLLYLNDEKKYNHSKCPCSRSHACRQMIMAAIGQQMADYPESTLKDIYKNFFQDAFGPGHLMSGDADAEERMKEYLRRECVNGMRL